MLVNAIKQWLQLNQNAPSGPQSTQQPDPYKVLGISRQASQEEIKRAYKSALAQYHPDKVNHLGSELKRVAEEKTKEITAAYNALK